MSENELFDQLVKGLISEEDYEFAKNSEFIKLGARVIVKDFGAPNSMANKKATIKSIDVKRKPLHYDTSVLIEFDDGFLGGHSGEGKCKQGRGWFVSAKYLKPIHDET